MSTAIVQDQLDTRNNGNSDRIDRFFVDLPLLWVKYTFKGYGIKSIYTNITCKLVRIE